MNQANPAAGDRLLSLRDFVMDVGCLQFGGLSATRGSLQTFLDVPFASLQLLSYLSIHLKILGVLLRPHQPHVEMCNKHLRIFYFVPPLRASPLPPTLV